MDELATELEVTCEMAVEKAIRDVANKHRITPTDLACQYINTTRSMDHYPACCGAIQSIILGWAEQEYTRYMRPIWAERYGWPTEEEEKND